MAERWTPEDLANHLAKSSKRVSARVPAPMSEAELLAAVKSLAKVRGFLTYHTHRSDRSEAGFPDLVLARKGRLIFAELKSETGKLTPEQTMWIELLRAAGVEAYVFRPADWLSGLVEDVICNPLN